VAGESGAIDRAIAAVGSQDPSGADLLRRLAALSIARLKLGENALKTRLAVVGLGKCGAQELNYVSDVDVLFVAEPEMDSDGTALVSNDQAVQIATRIAAEMTRICSAHTSAGTIYRR
jgi:glutamate-ammonia-ligase adenylyltransferase